MNILGVNSILNWCQVSSGGRRYTCPMKKMDGKLHFHFKKKWHKVSQYATKYTEELFSEGGKVLSRKFK